MRSVGYSSMLATRGRESQVSNYVKQMTSEKKEIDGRSKRRLTTFVAVYFVDHAFVTEYY